MRTQRPYVVCPGAKILEYFPLSNTPGHTDYTHVFKKNWEKVYSFSKKSQDQALWISFLYRVFVDKKIPQVV